MPIWLHAVLAEVLPRNLWLQMVLSLVCTMLAFLRDTQMQSGSRLACEEARPGPCLVHRHI